MLMSAPCSKSKERISSARLSTATSNGGLKRNSCRLISAPRSRKCLTCSFVSVLFLYAFMWNSDHLQVIALNRFDEILIERHVLSVDCDEDDVKDDKARSILVAQVVVG
eukprot:m.198339 g.198339  ORF g.198339 m.198339 type:complete len:109 (-) comp16835_c0_seq14:18-344(-)